MRVALLLLSLAVMFSGCSKKLVGYETRTVFIADGGDVNGWTKQGWEIKSARRAYEDLGKDYLGYSKERWGNEYVLQKPIYR